MKLLLGILFVISLNSSAQTLTFKDHGKIVKQVSVQDLKKLAEIKKISVIDANEMDLVTYEGYSASDLLTKVYGKAWKNSDEVLFTCLDGYQPSVPAKHFEESEGFFAIKRAESENFSITNKHENNKQISVGPYYLVWKVSKPGDEGAWPYQVVTVDLVTFAEKFPKIAPPLGSSSKIRKGFLAFRNNCLSCHTINGDGGHGAPELNYPVNVTEYYREDLLRKWINDPRSIRFNTTMPGLDKETPGHDAVLDDIVSYLKAMAKNKIKPAVNSDASQTIKSP